MMQTQYQGLFYLFSGLFTFSTMLCLFRGIAETLARKNQTSTKSDSDLKWLGIEELEILKIISDTEDIKSFVFKRKDGRAFPLFSPGQFLSFQIGEDEKLFRSYSISSSPQVNHTIQVSIKKIKDGLGSGWFHSLNVGDTVRSHGPAGLFTDEKMGNSERVFVAGGIGITPFVSMISSAFDLGQKHRISLFYGGKTFADLAFHHLLVFLSHRFNNFNYVPVLSGDAPKEWTGKTGRISLDLMEPYIEDLQQSHFFFCGPPQMSKAIMKQLADKGVNESHIHDEEFVSPTSLNLDDIPERNVKISFDGQDYSYQGKQNLLEFFEEQNVSIPFACRSGVCGACKVKCEDGEFVSLSDAGLNSEEKKDHLLTCVSWPAKDLKLKNGY